MLESLGSVGSIRIDILLGIFGLYIGTSLFWAYFLSPLKHIPGSIWASTFQFPLVWNALTGARARWIKESHERYGPVIRISPTKVAVSSEDGIKKIYNAKTKKSTVYNAFRFRDVQMCIGLLDVKVAHQRRKCLLPAFSRQNLLDMEPVITSHLRHFLTWLERFADKRQPVDCYRWFRFLTFDVITDIAFGQQTDMIGSGDTTFGSLADARVKRNAIGGPFPWAITFLRLIPYKPLKVWLDADEGIAAYAFRARQHWATTGDTDKLRVDMLARMEENGRKNPDEALTDLELIAEIMEVLNAGSDTTASTATYICYELARNLEAQDTLYEELREASPDKTHATSAIDLEKLPFLDSVCKEGLRLHSTIPSLLERIVPAGGIVIDDIPIPENTIIGMQAYTNHRDARIFPDPESFKPQRWLNETASMKANFIPFSSGPRMCIGQQLATLQLRIHIGTILRHYSVSLAPETTADSMSHVEFFTIRPKSSKCNLIFEKRED